jgi:hypothetical protein
MCKWYRDRVPHGYLDCVSHGWSIVFHVETCYFRGLRVTDVSYMVCRPLGFNPFAVQCDLFIGPGFDSRARLPGFGPIVSVAYVTCPHDWRISMACGKIELS